MILYILVLLRQCPTVQPRLASNSSSPCLTLLITGLKKQASMPGFNISIVIQNQWRRYNHPLLDPGLQNSWCRLTSLVQAIQTSASLFLPLRCQHRVPTGPNDFLTISGSVLQTIVHSIDDSILSILIEFPFSRDKLCSSQTRAHLKKKKLRLSQESSARKCPCSDIPMSLTAAAGMFGLFQS